jgi:hypothetical protein
MLAYIIDYVRFISTASYAASSKIQSIRGGLKLWIEFQPLKFAV